MKKIPIVIYLVCMLTSVVMYAETKQPDGQFFITARDNNSSRNKKLRSSSAEFFITKVNRIEKMYVIPPECRDFMGSRGVEKFDYQRILPNAERGENYIVTFRYRGKPLISPLKLKFEYRLALDLANPCVDEYEYPNLKTNSYKWTFENLEPRYITKGKVDRWKVSLILDGTVVAEKRSSSWYAMEGT